MSRAPGPYAPPPYRQPAGGNVYFKVLPGIRGLSVVWIEALRLYADLSRIPHPAAPQKRVLLARHIASMEEKIRAAEVVVAEATDTFVRERIAATQVRPDNPSGPRMITGIKSRPIIYPDLPAFAVGQVDISVLDKAATGVSGKPYWPSQEFGYTGHVGRRMRGSFMGTRPDPSMFRVHPVFTVGRPWYKMTIRKPIEERAFLRSGVMAGALLRQRMWKQIEAEAVREVTRILTFGTTTSRSRSRR